MESNRPNILMIVTDQHHAACLGHAGHPDVRTPGIDRLAAEGVVFRQAFCPSALCVPSRVSMLTGQYGHNNGVLGNTPGYPVLKQKANVLPSWLRRAGYNTAHVGKWLHHYLDFVNIDSRIAPGWDEWHTLIQPRYFSYELQVNGDTESFKHGEHQYITRVLNKRATNLIKEWGPESDPFYIQLDNFAPHSGKGDSGRCHAAAVPDPVERKTRRTPAPSLAPVISHPRSEGLLVPLPLRTRDPSLVMAFRPFPRTHLPPRTAPTFPGPMQFGISRGSSRV